MTVIFIAIDPESTRAAVETVTTAQPEQRRNSGTASAQRRGS